LFIFTANQDADVMEEEQHEHQTEEEVWERDRRRRAQQLLVQDKLTEQIGRPVRLSVRVVVRFANDFCD
jgi:hypothetical protein